MAGALTGVHRLEVDKPHPFKPDEEKKHGGKIHGHEHHSKLGRKRGGSVKKKTDGIVGQDGKPSNHGTDAVADRGMKLGTHVQETPMSGTESGYGGKTAFGKGHIEDSLKDGGKVNWIKKAINPEHGAWRNVLPTKLASRHTSSWKNTNTIAARRASELGSA